MLRSMFVGVYPAHLLRLSDEFNKDDEYGKNLDSCSLVTSLRGLSDVFTVQGVKVRKVRK
jgi:hypothetical protein